MKLRILGLLLALAFVSGLYGCEKIKELTGQGEEEKEEGAAEEGDGAKAAKQAEAATEEANKATAAAEHKAAEATAELEKAKAETEQAKADVEKTKAEAEDAKGRIEDKAKRQSLTKDLAEFTAEALNLKNQVKVAKDAWSKVGDTDRVGILDDVLEDLGGLETERTVVEGLMVQGKLDEARTKLEVVKAKFPAVKQKCGPTLSEKPVDPVQWKAMLDILAEESCLTKRNLPAQDFQVAREQLFTTYSLDRVVYEQLRAQFNTKPRQEDQIYLSQKVKEVCTAPLNEAAAVPAEGEAVAAPAEGEAVAAPAEGEAVAAPAEGEAVAAPAEGEAVAVPAEGEAVAAPAEGEAVAAPAEGEAATEEAVATETEKGTGEATDEEVAAADAKASEEADAEKKAEEKKAEEKKVPATLSGKYTGKLMVPGRKGSTIKVALKKNKASGSARIGNVTIKLSGKFKDGKGKLTGKVGNSSINCPTTAKHDRLMGKCAGKFKGAPFKNARFTAR
jgi:membrane protein involved in colicin uptake